MAREVGGGEERRRGVLHQRALVGVGFDPEHDDVAVALAGVRINGVGSGIAEEHERLPADLIDRVVLRAGVQDGTRHRERRIVDVGHPGTH
jgi:hypothetical protein